MKNYRFHHYPWLACALISGTSVAHAQVPLPTPQPVSSEVRQKLRAAILEIALPSDPRYSNDRPDLALPLAQLGDWNTALRLLRDDMNAPRRSDELWQWRAYQLARAGKWREVPAAASHIQRPEVAADTLLFAARTAIERGVVLHVPVAASRELETLLLASAPLLAKRGTIQQKAYRGYLWARGGDYPAAERIFARTFQEAQRRDAQEKAEFEKRKSADAGRLSKPREAKGRPEEIAAFFSPAEHTRRVLSLQARAGLLHSALQHADQADDFLLGWWIAAARTQADLEALREIVEKLPAGRHVQHLFSLSILSSVRGDRDQGRAWFEQARQLAQRVIAASPNERGSGAVHATMLALYAAHFLQDEALQSQMVEELRALLAQSPSMAGGLTPEEIMILLPLLDLKREQMVGDALPPLSSARLDEIAATLRAAPASELQFRALEIVATQYFLRKQPKKLLPVTQTLLQTAQALAAAERAKLDKESGFFNPYRPQPPRVLTAIFWLQRAGDEATAANFARDFTRHVPARERPYAAMTLFQLGFPQLADSIFDPVREIPRIAAQRRADWKQNRVDWSLFTSWDKFAAAEARFRAPDAPFRWFDKVAKENRAQVLRTWVMTLYPEPGLKSPFVRVTPAGSSASF